MVKKNPVHCQRECKLVQSLWKTIWSFQKNETWSTILSNNCTSECLYTYHKEMKNSLFQIWMRHYQIVQCNSSIKGQLTSQIWSKPERLSSSFNLWTNVWHLRGKDTFIDWLLYASYRAKCFHTHLVVAMKVLLSDFFLTKSIIICLQLLGSEVHH